MYKNIYKRIVRCILTTFLVGLCVCGCNQNMEESNKEVDVMRDYISYAPGVTEEMYHADYWISQCDNPDQVKLDASEIDALNENIMKEDGLVYDIWNMDTVFDGDARKNVWAKQEVPEYPLYRDGIELTAKDYESYRANIVDVATSKEQSIRYGICVKRADVKSWPESAIVSDAPNDTHYDEFQLTACRVNTPAIMDGETKDGAFYHVITYDYEGWVSKECFAICKDRTEWMQAQTMQECLVVTTPRLRLEETGELVTMGTQLRLLTNEEVGRLSLGRSAWGCFVAEIPVRDDDGAYQTAYTVIPQNEDVHVGFLPYTTANTIQLAFEFLGNAYGWGGMSESVDCSQLIQEVFACFGVKLPRDGSAQSSIPLEMFEFTEEMSEKERDAKLDELNAGSQLFFPGHTMIYLGKVDGEYYVLSSCGSLALPDETPTDGEVKTTRIRSAIINSLSVKRSSGITWKDAITKAIPH